MKKIAIFTTTRAEFGIFSALLKAIDKTDDIDYFLFVGGSHLANKYGNTINEIKNNFQITDTFDFFLNENSNYSLTKSLGIETFELADLFKNYDFDFCCILGDRFELLPIVNTSIVFKKSIIHLHGGEKSEGAIDEQIRHMITKAAHIHFASCREYADNIRKMGEQEWRIFNVGDRCFIGSGTVVYQGVEIAADVVIDSGSLVRKNIDGNGIYAGNPLKRYK